jgi:glutamyl-tRNA reductase
MNLFMVGVDHTTAAVAVRECIAFNDQRVGEALLQLTQPIDGAPPLLEEAVVLSTCNRVEIYGVSSIPDREQAITEFLAAFHHLPLERFARSLFFHFEEEVVHHLFETTAGLRSVVLGEAQIQGQVRRAFGLAQRVQSCGPVLSRLFSRAINVGKRVRCETNLGEGAASVSQAAIELAESQIGSLNGHTVLLIGSGKVSELAAQNLLVHGATDLLVVNRTLENAQELAARYGAQALTFDQLPEALAAADIIISSTSAPHYVLSRDMIAAAMQASADRATCSHCNVQLAPSKMLIDLAVPRDIDPEVVELPGVSLFTVDDLQDVVQSTLVRRSGAIAAARTIVDEEQGHFDAWLLSQETLPVLSSWRQQAEELRDAEVQRAMRRLADLSPEQQYIVEALSRSLVNKILHYPTLRAKDAAAHGEGKRYTSMLRELWSL